MDRDTFEQARRRATAEHNRRHRMQLASTLAFYLRDGGACVFRQHHPGDGSGVPDGHLRICFEVEAPLFLRTFGQLERRHTRRRGATR